MLKNITRHSEFYFDKVAILQHSFKRQVTIKCPMRKSLAGQIYNAKSSTDFDGPVFHDLDLVAGLHGIHEILTQQINRDHVTIVPN